MSNKKKIRQAKKKNVNIKKKQEQSSPSIQLFSIEGFRPLLLIFFLAILLMYSAGIKGKTHGIDNYKLACSLVFNNSQFASEIMNNSNENVDSTSREISSSKNKRKNPTYYKKGIGAALTALPTLIFAKSVNFLFHSLMILPKQRIYSLFYELPYTWVTVILSLFAVFVMYKTAELFGSPLSALLAVIGIVFSSPFFFSVFRAPARSEGIGLFWVTIFFHFTLVIYFNRKPLSKKLLFFIGFTFAMIISTEWSLLPLVVLTLLLSGRGKNFVRNLKSINVPLLMLFFGFLAGIIPQIVKNKIIFNQFIVSSFNPDYSLIINNIFHPRLGLLFQFPFVFFAVLGISILLKIDKKLFLILFLSLIVTIFFSLSDTSIVSKKFGRVGLIYILPLLVAGGTLFVDNIRRKKIVSDYWLLFVSVLGVFWTITQMGAIERFSAIVIKNFSQSDYLFELIFGFFSNVSVMMHHSFLGQYMVWNGKSGAAYFFIAVLFLIFAILNLFFIEKLMIKMKQLF